MIKVVTWAGVDGYPKLKIVYKITELYVCTVCYMNDAVTTCNQLCILTSTCHKNKCCVW